MSLTFGVTRSHIESDMRGADLTEWETDIDEWIADAAALVSVHLRHEGYDAAVVEGYGNTDDLYRTCHQYVIHKVVARVSASGTHQDQSLYQMHQDQATAIEDLLHVKPESVTPNHDSNKQRGSFRANVDLPSTRPDRTHAPGGFWRKGMKF